LPVKADGTYWMENGGWDNGRSVDEVAAYIAYALRVLKNVDLPCAGFTTPGGFGNGGKGELSRAGLQAVRSVFGTEVPHYFKYVVTEPGESTQPRVEFASGLTSDAPECIVNVPACTGDWFGGWDATSVGEIGPSIDRFITTDFLSGRLVEVIGSGEPAAFLCHWPGLYCHGAETGFRIFQGVVKRVNQAYGDRIRWMKLSEIARYWAAKELTAWMRDARTLDLRAPFACDGFTMRIATKGEPKNVRVKADENLSRVQDADRPLKRGQWRTTTGRDGIEVCFDLPKGVSQLRWE
ncbi:MAG: hypothetical protein KDM64_11590, partial [Verrucomicrobiae bacterium]|nr:hypothetical protein [Verrucomicrobiae bacterium]